MMSKILTYIGAFLSTLCGLMMLCLCLLVQFYNEDAPEIWTLTIVGISFGIIAFYLYLRLPDTDRRPFVE